jgi:hypothetical protein
MITITAILNAIEAHAERAIVPELRLIKKEVEKLRPSLYPDDQEHADALLLKLDRLLSDQVVVADRQPASWSKPFRQWRRRPESRRTPPAIRPPARQTSNNPVGLTPDGVGFHDISKGTRYEQGEYRCGAAALRDRLRRGLYLPRLRQRPGSRQPDRQQAGPCRPGVHGRGLRDPRRLRKVPESRPGLEPVAR